MLTLGCLSCFFFFSSRRRHTSSLCDWSSDVCYSDLETSTVNALSADTGVGKTWLLQDLAVTIVLERPWLGREVRAGKVLYIDEENPARVVKSRLRALGLNERFERIVYYSRRGIAIGEDGWT